MQFGIYLLSSPQTTSATETGNEIGGSAIASGNTITYGVTNTPSDLGLNFMSTSVYAGIYFRNTTGNSCRYNSITSNTNLTLASTGVIFTGTNPVGISYSSTVSNNTIAITSSGIVKVAGIDFGFGISTGTMICNNNNITFMLLNE